MSTSSLSSSAIPMFYGSTIIFGLSNIFYLKLDVVEGCVFGANLMRVLFSTKDMVIST
jgi:hypothetical protein